MSKGLEALKNIKIRCHQKVVWDDPIEYDLDTIEKSLKALEIIKEKRVACDLLTNPDVMDYKKYNSHCDKYDFIVPLTEEEFNLLKEMLEFYAKEGGKDNGKI